MKTAPPVAAILIVVLVCVTDVQARTWYVEPGGTGDVTTIAAGLDSAVYGDTVLVACGAYDADYMFMGAGIVLLSETGNPECVTISGQFEDSSILDCLADSLTRIEGFTMTDAGGFNWGALRIRGGGIVKNCRFEGNFCWTRGGGVDATYTTFVNCDFGGNWSEGTSGGMTGVHVTLVGCDFGGNWNGQGAGGAFSGSAGQIDSCTFSGNDSWFEGGAIWGHASTITNSVFENNSTRYEGGGAISGGAGYLADCTFRGNEAGLSVPGSLEADGGAIWGGAAVMERCTFIGNSSPYGQGGAVRYGGGRIGDCIFSGNFADYGGALHFGPGQSWVEQVLLGEIPMPEAPDPRHKFPFDWAREWLRPLLLSRVPEENPNVAITSSVFRNNSVYVDHGAVYAGYDVSITSSVFYGNRSPGNGGSLTAVSNATVSHSIISFGGMGGAAVYCEGSAAVTVECSDVYGNAGGDWVGCIAGQLGVDGNISQDPLFNNPAAGDYSLLPGSPCLPENNSCGLMGPRTMVCGDYFTLICPDDHVLPAFSTAEYIVLEDFRIRNDYCDPRSFEYEVAITAGPAVLIDNGDPLSMGGITPVLNPGETYVAPDAALDIPAIRQNAEQFVWYRVTPAGDPGAVDSCATWIDFTAPVPVLITAFDVSVVETGVGLRWRTVADEAVAGFHVYRSVGDSGFTRLNGRLLSPGALAYTDGTAAAGQAYRYMLGVVLEDGSETRSRAARIRTRPLELALGQNHPNPFNPSTTIAFVMPQAGHARVSIYDVRGKLVTTLIDGVLPVGSRQITWDGTDNRGNGVGSGVYFYRLETGKRTLTKRMILLK
jgi:hypothetical protein